MRKSASPARYSERKNAPAFNGTGCLNVNQYRWINFWTAFLGEFLTSFPAIFARQYAQ
ncbi:MAG TPA: hypothetical protein DCY50_07860 [Franconibacter helveticus]|nr:hypothetical protein [Franconibacter helveticus]